MRRPAARAALLCALAVVWFAPSAQAAPRCVHRGASVVVSSPQMVMVQKEPRAQHPGRRHSAITHLAADNVALPMLMAKSHHTSLRSPQKYARPSADAVAALTAAHDPERRRL